MTETFQDKLTQVIYDAFLDKYEGETIYCPGAASQAAIEVFCELLDDEIQTVEAIRKMARDHGDKKGASYYGMVSLEVGYIKKRVKE